MAHPDMLTLQVTSMKSNPLIKSRAKVPPKVTAAARENKSLGAYRTISEVAVELGVAAHVLRFWEGKFAQISPLKQSGGRRYYRPEDIALLRLIRGLLYEQGYTIKGVQAHLSKANKRELKAAVDAHLTPRELRQELVAIRTLLVDESAAT